MSTKKAKQNQQYDEYWKLTVEYSDILGDQFNNTLKIIIKFIDDNLDKINNINITKYKENDDKEKKKLSILYKQLQNLVDGVYHKADMGSTRKSINQFVKLGFINPYLKGYHRLAKKFLLTPLTKQSDLLKSRVSNLTLN